MLHPPTEEVNQVIKNLQGIQRSQAAETERLTDAFKQEQACGQELGAILRVIASPDRFPGP